MDYNIHITEEEIKETVKKYLVEQVIFSGDAPSGHQEKTLFKEALKETIEENVKSIILENLDFEEITGAALKFSKSVIIGRLNRRKQEIRESVKHFSDVEFLDKQLKDMELPPKVIHQLKRMGIETVEDLLREYPTKEQAAYIRNIGTKSLEDITNVLKTFGIKWE